MKKQKSAVVKIIKEPFGFTKDGKEVSRYTLTNNHSMCVRILDYGCIIQNIFVPDQNGQLVDTVLGYDDLAGYETGSSFFGAFVGRYANRIKGASFVLNGKTIQLEKNDGQNHLHGVYSRQVFEGSLDNNTLLFRRISPDGEEGFPGNLSLEVRYTLTEENSLEIEYTACSDADTVLNLTNHSYFNLNGDGGDILNHTLWLQADSFTEGDAQTLPTGKILSVKGTPMDFLTKRPIGSEIASDWDQLKMAGGYDHNFILNGTAGTIRKFAESTGDRSGITLEAFTTQAAVQLYTGNHVDKDSAPCGKGGIRYPRHAGFCLETQHYPCSPNFPEFPTTVLRSGEKYREKTVYKFKDQTLLIPPAARSVLP